MHGNFFCDVYLSHSSADRPRAWRLAEQSRVGGLRMWFDAWLITPGDEIYLAIERGLEAALGSEWVALERSTIAGRLSARE